MNKERNLREQQMKDFFKQFKFSPIGRPKRFDERIVTIVDTGFRYEYL